MFLNLAGYQTAYSQLAFAGKKEHDMLSETVPQLKMGLAKQLEKLGASHPGKVHGFTFVLLLLAFSLLVNNKSDKCCTIRIYTET